MGRIYRRGQRWGIDYTNADGKRVRESVGDTKAGAEEVLRERERRELRIKEGIISRVNNRVPLADVCAAYKEHIKLRNRAKTVKNYVFCIDGITKFLNVQFVDEITPEAVERFLNRRIEEVSVQTANMSLIVFKIMLTWATETRLIASNPIAGVKRLRQVTKRFRRALDEKEVTALLAASPERYRRMWFCFLTTGLRLQELTTLQWDDVDFEGGKIRIRGEVSKNWHEAGLPMSAGLRDMLERMAAETGEDVPTGTVFLNERGVPIKNNLLRAFKVCVNAAGIPLNGLCIHALRHTFATILIRNGASIKVVQSLMWHASAMMTLDIYGHLFPEDTQAAVDSLPFAFGTDMAQSQSQSQPDAAKGSAA